MSLAEWDGLIRVARSAGLLARLGENLEAAGVLEQVPEAPRRHLEWDMVLGRKHVRDIHWEVERIRRILSGQDIPMYLLKGAAYVVAELPAAQGRLFGDIDVLVPHERLESAEAVLFRNGWIPSDLDPYDAEYYRRWMHQVPPMHHLARQTTIDLHHTIVPPTARMNVDANIVLQTATPVGEDGGLWVLSPANMVIHSATHLFNEGEFERGLRDLTDLDILFRHFGAQTSFWSDLVDAAQQLGLAGPVFYAAFFAKEILSTPVPAEPLEKLAALNPAGAITAAIMKALFRQVLRPHHRFCKGRLFGLTAWLLYVRSHWLRMPLHLLLPHLLRKGIKRRLHGE